MNELAQMIFIDIFRLALIWAVTIWAHSTYKKLKRPTTITVAINQVLLILTVCITAFFVWTWTLAI